MATIAQAAVLGNVAALGTPARPVDPPVTDSQLDATLNAMFKKAKVPNEATIPDNCIRGVPITRATAAATTAPNATATCAGSVVPGREGNSADLVDSGITRIAVVYAPMAMNPMWPNEKTPELPMKMYIPTTRITLINALSTEVRTALDAMAPYPARSTTPALRTRGAKCARDAIAVCLIFLHGAVLESGTHNAVRLDHQDDHHDKEHQGISEGAEAEREGGLKRY